jgi:two-component system OmpR family sensor kinase
VNNSLQRRLSIWLGLAIVSTGILATVVSFFLAHSEAKEFQDHMLKQLAFMAASDMGRTMQPESLSPDHAMRTKGSSAGRIVIVRLPEDPRPGWLAGNLKPGFRTLEADGKRMRVFLREEASGKTTVVAQLTDTRDEIVLNSTLLALVPLLLILPLMVWLIVRIVRSELVPVNQLAADLDAQPADRLSLLSDRDVPDEIVPFVQAINRLLKRVNNLMGQQRRFIADAAHELRSPLTALSIQSQNLEKSGTLETMRERVQPLQAGIERARKLTEQLLNLARTQAETLETSDVDVSAIARELIAEYLPLSEAKGIDLGLDEIAPLTFLAAQETLLLVLRNALENALKYTPEGGEVTLRLYSDDVNDIVEVVDNGPGIPVFERERVFDPFYRIPGTAGEGSGLGLSIAREAAARQGGKVSLLNRTEGSGLIFRYQQVRKS